MMDSACAEYDVLRKQKQAVGTGIQQPVFYDLCQTVYLSPQICIPAGDVDACLSMVSSLLRLCIFQTALKNTFFPWYYFRTLARAGKDMVSLGGYCSSPCV